MKRLLPIAAIAALRFVSCTNFGGVTETIASREGSLDRLGCGGPLCTRARADWPMPHGPTSGFPNPMSYTVSGGVVTDEVTRLQWEQSANTTAVSWEDAARHCDSLELGGFSDWRLPSKIELLSLVDFTKSPSPAGDDSVFPDLSWRSSSEHTFWTFERAEDSVQTDFEGEETFRSKVFGAVSFTGAGGGGTTSNYDLQFGPDSEPTTSRVRCVRR